ncbi:cholinesterase-like [Glandiceps talaboti]
MTGLSIIFILVVVTIRNTIGQGDDGTLLTIPQGTLRGNRIQVGNTFYINSFLKIPYVEPPLGDLRFRPPLPGPTWTGILNATKFGPGCPQFGKKLYDLPSNLPTLPPKPPIPGLPSLPDFSNFTGLGLLDEDCLSLNVFAPEITVGTNKFPVMVFIQGGGYVVGADLVPLYNGAILAEKKQVVVVTFNYRLGALGFLSTKDDVCPGNYGILDQVAALEWVRDNIRYFGGDPKQVTIFGESAGAASVGLHLISPLSRGLFHAAIAESGSPLCPWAFKEYPHDIAANTQKLARDIGCPTEPSTALVECLRTKDAMEISKYGTFNDGTQTGPFEPTTDGPTGFMPLSPIHYIQNGLFVDVPVMMGYNKDETAPAILNVPGVGDGFSRETFRQLLWDRLVTERKYGGNKNASYEDILNAMEFQYTPWESPYNETKLRDSFVQCVSDATIVEGVYELADYTSKEIPTYVYRFDYRSIHSFWPEWAGVPHVDELMYVFGTPFKDRYLYRNFTDADEVMSDTIMTLWTNFAKTGNPTPLGQEIQNVEGRWERYSSTNKMVMRFSPDGSSYMTDEVIDFSNLAFWHIYDPQVVESATTARCNCTSQCADVQKFKIEIDDMSGFSTSNTKQILKIRIHRCIRDT